MQVMWFLTVIIMQKFQEQLFPYIKKSILRNFINYEAGKLDAFLPDYAGIYLCDCTVKIVYRMYRRRPEYKVNYDEFLKILKQVPENDNMCIVRDGKMIFKTVLQDNLYERIEEYQGDREFYMPSPEEVLDYAKHGYPSEDRHHKKTGKFPERRASSEYSSGYRTDVHCI